MKKLVSIILILFLFSACSTTTKEKATGSSFPVDKQPDLSTREIKELEIGNKIYNQIISSFYLYTEPKVNTYIAEVGQKLASYAQRNKLPYKFIILYSDKIYSTSSVGGFVYVTTGFLNLLENEAELAAVLAHEIAQIQYKDPRLSMRKSIVHGLAVASGLVGSIFGQIGSLAAMGMNALDVFTEAKPKPERVYKADKYALEYMVKAGYDPQGMFDVLYKITQFKDKDITLIMDYTETHPLDEKRIKNLKEQFEKLDLAGKTLHTYRDIYLTRIKAVKEIYRQ